MRKLLFIILLLSGSLSLAQNDVTKELTEVLENDTLSTRSKSQAINHILNQGYDLDSNENRLVHVLNIIAPYEEPEFYWGWHIAYNTLLTQAGENSEAVSHAYKMLEEAEKRKNKFWESDAYVQLYYAHLNLGMTALSKDFLKKAYDVSLQNQDMEAVTQVAYLLGYNYYFERKNDSAIVYLEDIMTHDSKMSRENRDAEYSYLLARTYARTGEHDSLAIALYHRIMNHELPYTSDYYKQHYRIGAKLYLGQLYVLRGQLDSGQYYFDQSLSEYRNFDISQANMSVEYMAITYGASGYSDRAIPLFESLLDTTDYKVEREYLAKAYEDSKQFEKSSDLWKDLMIQKDSINRSRADEMKSVMDKNAAAELEKEQELNDQKAQLAEERLSSQSFQKKLILWGAIIIGVVIAFFGRALLKRYKVIKEQKHEIDLQKQVLEEKNQEIVDSITYAKRIQNAILPAEEEVQRLLPNSFILYKPKDIVAGDFYWMEEHEQGVLFAAADCTGHGVPGAMVSVVCNNALNRSVREYDLQEPALVLDKTRELVLEEFKQSSENVKDGMDIALCRLKDNKLQYSGAHNALWIIRNGSEEIEEIKANKQPIGEFDGAAPFTNHEVQLSAGDQFYIFSDGYADQFGGDKGKKLKSSNFKKLLIKHRELPMNEQLSSLDSAFEEWRGDNEQLDDVCVIGVRI